MISATDYEKVENHLTPTCFGLDDILLKGEGMNQTEATHICFCPSWFPFQASWQHEFSPATKSLSNLLARKNSGHLKLVREYQLA